MQVLSRFNEGDLIFIAHVTDKGVAWISGPCKVTNVTITTTRTAQTLAWEVGFIYATEQYPATNYREPACFSTIEEAVCSVDSTVHPRLIGKKEEGVTVAQP
jgi:hypothetical protein